MSGDSRQSRLAENFDRAHAARARSRTLERIYRDAFGHDNPEEANPSAFFSRTTLRRLAAALHVGPGKTLWISAAGTVAQDCGLLSNRERTSLGLTCHPAVWR